MDGLCEACRRGASGEHGHEQLAFYVGGPYPGHHIFKCEACGERWIRSHGGEVARHGWVRYSEQFAMRKPAAIGTRATRVS